MKPLCVPFLGQGKKKWGVTTLVEAAVGGRDGEGVFWECAGGC